MSEFDLSAAARRATRAMAAFCAAWASADAAYQAEVAAAHFEGRVPPSREVFAEQELAGP